MGDARSDGGGDRLRTLSSASFRQSGQVSIVSNNIESDNILVSDYIVCIRL
jgi:hypothetical protein